MNGPDEFTLRGFEETELPNTSYTVFNSMYAGSPLTVQPKNPNAGHSSFTPGLDDHPTVFQNLGYAVVHPDRHGPTTSKTPATMEHLKRGSVVVYEKDDFFECLDVPGLAANFPNHTANVVAFYPFDGGENYTLTYYFNRKVE